MYLDSMLILWKTLQELNQLLSQQITADHTGLLRKRREIRPRPKGVIHVEDWAEAIPLGFGPSRLKTLVGVGESICFSLALGMRLI